MKDSKSRLDLAAIRERLSEARGLEYWRSLEEIAETDEFRDFLENEFPQRGEDWRDAPNRREMLRLMAASLAMAGLSACVKQPSGRIVPYVRAPEEIVPGKPLYYATAMEIGGVALGLLAESHMGRPTKVEGNPDHPGSLGATHAFAQASVLSLYDPDRSQVVLREGRISSWPTFLGELNQALEQERARHGAGLRILTGTVSSPSLAAQLQNALQQYPQAKWVPWEPAAPALPPFHAVYRFDQADVVLSLDADFLGTGTASVRYARDFMERRRRMPGMSRLYVVEPMPSPTGTRADHRAPLRAGEIEGFARAVAKGVGVAAEGISGVPWIPALVKDLQAHRGRCVVVPGDFQPASVHLLARQMNQALGNAGRTVVYGAPLEASPTDQLAGLRELIGEMNGGKITLLVIVSGNPAYTAPADLDFAGAMKNVKTRVHLAQYYDETSELCHWHIPETHYLEAWGDTRAYDGTVTIQQPLIEPLYGGKPAIELVAAIGGNPDMSAHDAVRQYWQVQQGSGDFETFWLTAVHNGVVPNTAMPNQEPGARNQEPGVGSQERSQESGVGSQERGVGLEIVFRPDPTVWDGRFANNGWLQELPKPVSKLTWDNAAYMSVATAERLGVTNEDVVELKYRGRSVRAPVFVVPGHANESVTVHLGYGRRRGGRIAAGPGFNAYTLRTSDALWHGSGLSVSRTGDTWRLAATQRHFATQGRAQVRAATLEEFKKDPQFANREEPAPAKELTMYPEWSYTGYAWGMAIDLNACTGCGACVAACNAENNIAVVGKEQVLREREMHWLRIDVYHRGSLDNPEFHNEPMLCQHCENAPCELVCPVNATVHSSEGLNQMVYNRCVGTRYCSNNCPYKVRRFNFLLFSDWETPSLYGLRNPDVTVRSRGVMEKCTYCVQRINDAKIRAEKEDRAVRDGEIVTACQQACPARAIVFGNINDPASQVAKLKADPRNYAVLGELNTRPRTTYLAAVRNPNPEIEGKA